MWLFLINPLKLCSYGSWSLQGYVCKSSCCQCHIYIYSCLDIEMFKTLSVHFIDWWLCRSHSAAVPEWLMQPLSHSARVADAATQPLCRRGWRSHSATLPEWLEQPLSHSVTLPEWLEQPLSHSVTLPEWLEQPLSHSATLSDRVAEWLMWKFPPLRVQSDFWCCASWLWNWNFVEHSIVVNAKQLQRVPTR